MAAHHHTMADLEAAEAKLKEMKATLAAEETSRKEAEKQAETLKELAAGGSGKIDEVRAKLEEANNERKVLEDKANKLVEQMASKEGRFTELEKGKEKLGQMAQREAEGRSQAEAERQAVIEEAERHIKAQEENLAAVHQAMKEVEEKTRGRDEEGYGMLTKIQDEERQYQRLKQQMREMQFRLADLQAVVDDEAARCRKLARNQKVVCMNEMSVREAELERDGFM